MRIFNTATALAVVVGALALAGAWSGEANASCVIPAPPNAPAATGNNLSQMTSDRVKLTGGCIDGVPIGQNTPAAGNFSALTINGAAVGGAGVETDPAVGAITGIPKADGAGNISAAVPGTDYAKITATACTGTEKVSAIDPASGAVTCSEDENSGLGGSGDVAGPDGATAWNIPAFDGPTGKLLQDSGLAFSSIATLEDEQTLTAKTIDGNNNSLTVLLNQISGLGADTEAWLAVPSSANFAATISDETGTGSVVFGTDPILTSPVISGVASSMTRTDGSGVLGAATAGTHYAAPTSGIANTPLFNNGSGGFTNGTVSGDTTRIVSMDASTPAANDCAKFDADGNLTTAGAACGSGGGGGAISTSDGTTTVADTSDITFGTGLSIVDDTGGAITVNLAATPAKTETGTSDTVQADDLNKTIRYTNAGAVTVTLTEAATLGNGFGFGVECDAASCAIDPNGAETVDGAASVTLAQRQKAWLSTDGTGWRAYVMPHLNPHALANITGVASGGLTFLATPSSANLRLLLTDEVGTGNFVTTTGARTTNNLTKFDASGNVVDAGISSVGSGSSVSNLILSTGSATLASSTGYFGITASSSVLNSRQYLIGMDGELSDLICMVDVTPADGVLTYNPMINSTADTNQEVTLASGVYVSTTVTNVPIAVTRGQFLTMRVVASGGISQNTRCTFKFTAS